MNSNEKHEEIDCAELERLAAFGGSDDSQINPCSDVATTTAIISAISSVVSAISNISAAMTKVPRAPRRMRAELKLSTGFSPCKTDSVLAMLAGSTPSA